MKFWPSCWNRSRCLDDRAIPPERRVRAIYNRGVCLLNRGENPKFFRVAIACFEECRDATTDDLFARDIRHNLELAKLLWHEARAKQKEHPTPNESIEDESPRPPMANNLPDGMTDDGSEPGAENGNRAGTQPVQQVAPSGRPATAQGTQQTPGSGTLPVVADSGEVQKLSPADTNALLDRADLRLRDARKKNEQMRAGPERPNVRDW